MNPSLSSQAVRIEDLIAALRQRFASMQIQEKEGDLFFFVGEERLFPFATLITKDEPHDASSELSREGVYRFHVGVSKETFLELFGEAWQAQRYDYTALDTLMPHPDYGKLGWLCVLNPTAERLEALAPLIQQSYARQANREARREGRHTTSS